MREKIITGNLYHILNRGVDKREIFLNEKDYLRFIHDLFEFNDTAPISNISYRLRNNINWGISTKSKIVERKPRKLLVEILVFCLMPNHYHLLVRPLFDDAIFKFIKRLNMGYAKYFNEKYKRTGALFEGRYKSILVKNETHFIHLPYYIHLNPLDLIMPSWREGKIENYKKAMEFLENYRWSSFPDYIGKKNFPSVTSREFLSEILGGEQKYKQATLNWLKDMSLPAIKDIILE